MSLPLRHHFVAPKDLALGCEFSTPGRADRCLQPWDMHYDSDDIQPIMERVFRESLERQQREMSRLLPITEQYEAPVFTPLIQQVDVGAETEVLTLLMGDASDQRGTDVPSYLLGGARALLALRKVLSRRQG